jgi:hypothetical protein
VSREIEIDGCYHPDVVKRSFPFHLRKVNNYKSKKTKTTAKYDPHCDSKITEIKTT